MQEITSKFRELKGKKVSLRFRKNADLIELQQILNDKETMRGLFKFFKTDTWTAEMVKHRYDNFGAKQAEGKGLTYCVVTTQDGRERVVGDCGLKNIDLDLKRAEWGIILHKSVWGSGIAQECLLLSLDYCFTELKLETICFENDNQNEMSKRFLEKAQIPFLQVTPEGKRYYEVKTRDWARLRTVLAAGL